MDPRTNALNDVLGSLNQKYGNNTVMRLGDTIPQSGETLSTGYDALDRAIGGGYPCGRIVEIYGPENSGQTSLALNAILSCQEAGCTAAFVDVQHSFNMEDAKRIGVKMNHLLFAQPCNLEQALDIVHSLVSSGAVDLVIVNSVAALVPQAELQGYDDGPQCSQARLMSKALRLLTEAAQRTNTTVIFFNQLRPKVGVTFGPTEETAGGNALKYYTSLRLEVRVAGDHSKVKVVKNKALPPFQEVLISPICEEGSR